MSDYYFLAASLPELAPQSELNSTDFFLLCRENLAPQDYAKIVVLRRWYDLQNLRALWKREPLNAYGNFNQIELEEDLTAQEKLPEYVFAFVNKYEKNEHKLRYFSELLSEYFSHEFKKSEGFVKAYLDFERNWRQVLTAIRARKLRRDVAAELQFEDVNDPLIAQILAQKDAEHFTAPDGFQSFQELIEEHFDDPLALQQALDDYRLEKIANLTDTGIFSLDRILDYTMRLIIIENRSYKKGT